MVAPLVGAWIEMTSMALIADRWKCVAPLVGAWIEIGVGHWIVFE